MGILLKHVWELLDSLPIKRQSKSSPPESRWDLVIALMNRCSCMISEQVSKGHAGETPDEAS